MPLVTVVLLTYNHGAFVEQSIRSVASQRLDGTTEVLVLDDASTDDTGDIVARLVHELPTVQHIRRPQNLGMMRNLAVGIAAARAPYVALLEGDDYWTADHKLADQVSFLEANPACTAVGHLTTTCDSDGGLVGEIPAEVDRRQAGLVDAVVRAPFHTSSLMFRKSVLPELPAWMEPMPMGDWPIAATLAASGPIGYLPEPMSMYRVHAGGVWQGRSRIDRLNSTIVALRTIQAHVGGPSAMYRNSELVHRWLLFDEQVRTKQLGGALRSAAAIGWRSPTTLLGYLRGSERRTRRRDTAGFQKVSAGRVN